MALKIKKTLDTGIDIEYWRVKSIVADSDNGTIVYCYGYFNQSARDTDKNHIDEKHFNVNIDIKVCDKKFIDECYIELKKDEFFLGSEDI